MLPMTVWAEPKTFKAVPLKFESLGTIQGTERWDWWQARTALVSGKRPYLLTTMSQTGKKVSHDFHDILQSISRDGGRTWTTPEVIMPLKRIRQKDSRGGRRCASVFLL